MENKVKNLLGGYNCGACGYESCEECAKAIIGKKTDASACILIENDRVEEIIRLIGENHKEKTEK